LGAFWLNTLISVKYKIELLKMMDFIVSKGFTNCLLSLTGIKAVCGGGDE